MTNNTLTPTLAASHCGTVRQPCATTGDLPAAEPTEAFTKSTSETLKADEIYGNNPALSTQNAAKDLSFGDVVLASFLGVAAFYCCCAANNNNNGNH